MTVDALPETPRICTPVQVMFFDTDCAAVVHNIAYLRFIEVARTLLAEGMGMDLAEMARTGLFPVVARTEIDYKRAARLSEKLEVHGWMEGFDRMRLWFGFEIRRPADGALIVTSRQMLVFVQLPAGKPLPIPAEWAERYPHLQMAKKGGARPKVA